MTFVQKLYGTYTWRVTQCVIWQYVEQANRSVFDVWLCSAADRIGVYHLLCVNSTWRGGICLIK